MMIIQYLFEYVGVSGGGGKCSGSDVYGVRGYCSSNPFSLGFGDEFGGTILFFPFPRFFLVFRSVFVYGKCRARPAVVLDG